MKAQLAFDRLVSQDFKKSSSDDVKTVVLAVWYENFVPDVSKLDFNSARAACYLLDRLMRYNCVSFERQERLLSIINLLSLEFNLDDEIVISTDFKVDKSARRWGLNSDLKLILREMLPYQTRHYKHMKH